MKYGAQSKANDRYNKSSMRSKRGLDNGRGRPMHDDPQNQIPVIPVNLLKTLGMEANHFIDTQSGQNFNI